LSDAQTRGSVMSDEFDWHFSDADDARTEIRAAVRYLLKCTAGSDRGDTLREIIEIVNEAVRGHDPLDDDMPGG
jgi:hypothetical protein